MKPRGRPHLKQRRTVRLENLGVRFALIIIDFFAMKDCSKEKLGTLHRALRRQLEVSLRDSALAIFLVSSESLKTKVPCEAHAL